jgi:hypothetical protein
MSEINEFDNDMNNNNNKNIKIENLLLDSGGIFGYTIVGALKYLEENIDMSNIKKYLGSSIGSLISLMLILDYSINEIFQIAYKLDLKRLIDIKNNNILDIVNNYGFDDGKKLCKLIKIIIRSKTDNDNITFKELYNFNGKELIIPGTNVSKKICEIFSMKTTPDMYVWEAIRISCSYPLVFQPYMYDNCYYVDGGANFYSVDEFNEKDNSLGILLENFEGHYDDINSFEAYMENLLTCPIRSLKYSRFNKKKCICIDVQDIKIYGLDLSVKNEIKNKLYNFGYENTKKQFKCFFNNYLKKEYRHIGTQTDFEN